MNRLSIPRPYRTALYLVVSVAAGERSAAAQTDFYNTDAGRPVSIEDAYPVERHAFELQLAPVMLERMVGGVYGWRFEPELAYGILPRTQFELALPVEVWDRAPDGRASGLGGVEISALYNLNVETETLPALAVAVEGLFPLGSRAPEDAYVSLATITTRTFRFVRIHLNGRWTLGPAALPNETDACACRVDDIYRWLAGMAIDRTFPLRSALLTAAVFADQPLIDEADVRWNAEVGARYQWSPTLAVDAGVGTELTGDDRGWAITFGAAYAFAIKSLIPMD